MLADLAPSLLDAIGARAPATMVGGSLWPLWSGATREDLESEQRGAVSQTQGSWALRESRYKLIAESGDPEARRLELYELESDPGERDDLADREPERARDMLERLRARLDALGIPPASAPLVLPECPLCEMRADSSFLGAELSGTASQAATDRESVREETRERLRTLGYLE
jgi:arylsulfatase A-like enzyme